MTPIDPAADLAASQPQRPRFDPWKLRCIREHRELTQGELGRAIGLSATCAPVAICRAEIYKQEPYPKRLQLLAHALLCTPADLCSTPDELAANRATFDRWTAEGRLNLRWWLRKQAAMEAQRNDH